MNIWLSVISIFYMVYMFATGCRSSPDIAKLEDDQKILLKSLMKNKDTNRDLDEKFEFLSKKDNTKSLNSISATVPPGTDENVLKVQADYSPPIIVLLPEDSTSREKWEYAVTLKCLGRASFDEFTNIHNTKMAKMAIIKGTTVSEIEAEIKETEHELNEVKMELDSMKEKKKNSKPPPKNDFKEMKRHLHLDHNIKLLNQEIHVMEVKLDRLKKRLKSAILFGNSTNNKENVEENKDSEDQEDYEGSPGGASENEDEEYED